MSKHGKKAAKPTMVAIHSSPITGRIAWKKDPVAYEIGKASFRGVRTLTYVETVPWECPPLPVGWVINPRERCEHSGIARRGAGANEFTVLWSATVEADGKRWLHVSCSFKNRMPSYQDLAEIKRLFCGPEATAYEIHPPEVDHINAHPYCRHLWVCLDGPVTPDFTRGNRTV